MSKCSWRLSQQSSFFRCANIAKKKDVEDVVQKCVGSRLSISDRFSAIFSHPSKILSGFFQDSCEVIDRYLPASNVWTTTPPTPISDAHAFPCRVNGDRYSDAICLTAPRPGTSVFPWPSAALRWITFLWTRFPLVSAALGAPRRPPLAFWFGRNLMITEADESRQAINGHFPPNTETPPAFQPTNQLTDYYLITN